MVVRFLPIVEQSAASPEREHGALAEVIELRSRLPQLSVPAAAPTEGERSRPRQLRKNGAIDSNPEVDSAESGRSAIAGHHGSSAADDAVRLLARKARSSGELRRELLAFGHDSPTVDAVILDCEGSLYLDDVGLARVLSESLRGRKRASRAQIRMKLRERLLPDSVVEQIVAEIDDESEDELLREAAVDRAHKLRGLDRQTAERRLLGFLARRGWSGERARRIARDALDGAAARGTVRFL